MELAQAQGAYGAAYLGALVSAPVAEPTAAGCLAGAARDVPPRARSTAR